MTKDKSNPTKKNNKPTSNIVTTKAKSNVLHGKFKSKHGNGKK